MGIMKYQKLLFSLSIFVILSCEENSLEQINGDNVNEELQKKTNQFVDTTNFTEQNPKTSETAPSLKESENPNRFNPEPDGGDRKIPVDRYVKGSPQWVLAKKRDSINSVIKDSLDRIKRK